MEYLLRENFKTIVTFKPKEPVTSQFMKGGKTVMDDRNNVYITCIFYSIFALADQLVISLFEADHHLIKFFHISIRGGFSRALVLYYYSKKLI